MLALVALILRERAPEPAHRGKSLSQWLRNQAILEITGQRVDRAEEDPEQAVQEIGTNALPHLISWVSLPDNSWQERVYLFRTKLLGRLGVSRPYDGIFIQSGRLAVVGFQILRNRAAPA